MQPCRHRVNRNRKRDASKALHWFGTTRSGRSPPPETTQTGSGLPSLVDLPPRKPLNWSRTTLISRSPLKPLKLVQDYPHWWISPPCKPLNWFRTTLIGRCPPENHPTGSVSSWGIFTSPTTTQLVHDYPHR